MGRIRTIKPDAFRSESLSSVPRETRWTFAGLWTYVDDAGRGLDNARLIWAELYPLDDDVTPEDVERDIDALARVGAVVRYSADGKNYLVIPAFDKHQAAAYRRSESHIPAPTDADLHAPARNGMRMSAGREGKGREYSCASPDGEREGVQASQASKIDVEAEFDQWYADLHAPARNGMRMSAGREGKGREYSCASPDGEREGVQASQASKIDVEAEFDQWYAEYPRKRGKGQALKAYRNTRKKVDAATLLDALRQQAPTLMAKGPEFCPYPATWLNGERWADEPDQVAAGTAAKVYVTEQPPDGLSSAEYREWYAGAVARAKAAR